MVLSAQREELAQQTHSNMRKTFLRAQRYERPSWAQPSTTTDESRTSSRTGPRAGRLVKERHIESQDTLEADQRVTIDRCLNIDGVQITPAMSEKFAIARSLHTQIGE